MDTNGSTTTLQSENRKGSSSKLSAKEQYQADFKRIMEEDALEDAKFWKEFGAKGKAKAQQDKKD